MKTVLPLLAEYLGTFLLTFAYISTSNILLTGAIFAVILYLIVPISGGCINPAVSWVMYLAGRLSLQELMYYVILQLLAGSTSYYIYTMLV